MCCFWARNIPESSEKWNMSGTHWSTFNIGTTYLWRDSLLLWLSNFKFFGSKTRHVWHPIRTCFFFVSCPCLAATDDISACRCTRIDVTSPRTLSLRLFSPPSPLVVLLCERFCPMFFVQNSPLVQVVKFEICVLRLVRMVKSWDQQAFEFVRFILVVNEWYFIVIIWSMTCLKAYL